ncbi:hypothetical protein NDU88_001706 [Pleurodeles waltl]|uniref:Uncharacterized protein n=1 Tax=Pleurodeles waltl TaxID=8319 RepID=A0AAV7NBW2_PLEWA|nr:hypothetical protein NDU88_001706 [Pleurodeles waltl]
MEVLRFARLKVSATTCAICSVVGGVGRVGFPASIVPWLRGGHLLQSPQSRANRPAGRPARSAHGAETRTAVPGTGQRPPKAASLPADSDPGGARDATSRQPRTSSGPDRLSPDLRASRRAPAPHAGSQPVSNPAHRYLRFLTAAVSGLGHHPAPPLFSVSLWPALLLQSSSGPNYATGSV